MAKRVTKYQRAEADEFHRTLVSLYRVPHGDWTEWEDEWMHDEVRRRPDYIFTPTEWSILKELVGYSKTVTEYAGCTVPELLQIAYRYRFDCSEDNQQLIERLHAWGATDLKIRQAEKLASICRMFEPLDEAA